MKTTKVILVAVLMTFAAIGFSQTDHNIKPVPTPQLSVLVPLTKAMNNPELVSAMRSQLNPSFLQTNQRIYTPRVKINRTVYYIQGTRNQWMHFFNLKEIAPRKR